MSKRISFLVHGTVQGWVRNTSDGKVQGEAQGPEAGIATLLKELNKGPRAAHVVKLEKQEVDLLDGEEGFKTLDDAVRVNGVVKEEESK